MLGAARAASACAPRFVIDLTARRLAGHGTKAAPPTACLQGTVLSAPTTPLNRKTHHATDCQPSDAHAATPSRCRRAHAAGLVVAVASVNRNGALAYRRRSVAMDRPRGACAGGRLTAWSTPWSCTHARSPNPPLPRWPWPLPPQHLRTHKNRPPPNQSRHRVCCSRHTRRRNSAFSSSAAEPEKTTTSPHTSLEGLGPKVDVQGGRARCW
jgi:hypothetical protein